MTPDDADETTAPRPQRVQTPPPAERTELIERTAVFQPTAVYDKTLTPGAPPPPAADVGGNGLPVGTFLGEFEITTVVGEGGFGIVYLAVDHSLMRRVALKEYMPSSLAARAGGTQVQVKSERYRETFEAGRKSFVNEARMLAQFDHPALVKVYRFWEANGTAYMVMPFYEGPTLKDLLRQLGHKPDEAWLRTLLAPLTEALAVIHAEQCYHRDIAPDNVILLGGHHARPLLLDFGAARRVIGDMTQALTVILKPGYAPIEQYAEVPGMKQGAWTDVYALAAVLYFAITGRTPPPAVGRLLKDSYQPLAGLVAEGRYSAGFLAAIDRALAVRPEQRTASIDALRADLGLGPRPVDAPGLPGASGPAASAAAADVLHTDIPLQLDDFAKTERYAPASDGHERTMVMPPPSARDAAAALPRATAASVASSAAPAAGPPRGLWIGVGAAVVAAAVAFAGYRMTRPAADAAPAGAAVPVETLTPVAPVTTAVPTAPPVTPPVAPLAAAPPAAPQRFDAVAEFERVVGAQTAGFTVRGQTDRPSFKIGRDRLAFTVESTREGFVTVLAHDGAGMLIRLYPNERNASLRVRPGQSLKLPLASDALDITEPAGTNRLLVMVSGLPRDYAALSPLPFHGFRTLPTGEQADRLLAAHTGDLPLLAGRPVCPAQGACTDEFGAVVVPVEVVR